MDSKQFNDEVRMEYYRATTQVVREIGFIAIKTLITLNSGAFVVLLTFIGNAAAQSQFVVPLEDLKFAMFCFLGGLASTFVSIVYTYITAQLATPYDRADHWTDKFFIPLMVLFPAVSFGSFLLGVITVTLGVSAI